MVLFHAGYFVNIDKSVLDPTSLIRHLGIMVDSQNRKFSVPQDRVDNLLALIEQMLSSTSCSLQDLERCVGKCRSMSIAVPCAILYTRAQYAALLHQMNYGAVPKVARRKVISISPGSDLEEELKVWLQLRTELVNGAMWMEVDRINLRMQAFTDASSRRWGGIFKCPTGVFRMGGIFRKERYPVTLM